MKILKQLKWQPSLAWACGLLAVSSFTASAQAADLAPPEPQAGAVEQAEAAPLDLFDAIDQDLHDLHVVITLALAHVDLGRGVGR